MFARIRTLIETLFAVMAETFGLAAAPAQAAPNTYAHILLTGTDIEVVRTVSASIDAWMVSNGKAPNKWETVPSGSMHNDACTEGLPASPSAEVMWYCSYNDTVYVGLDMIHEFRAANHAGRLSPVAIMWHEAGHAVAWKAGSHAMFEDQADCFGGTGLARDNTVHSLNVSLADVPALNRMIAAISRPDWMSRAEDEHGTRLERGTAMLGGYLFGAQSCNNWDRAHPLVR